MGVRFVGERFMWRVGDGTNIDTYNDLWLTQEQLFQVFSPRVLPLNSKVSDLILPSRVWDIGAN